MSHTPGTWEQGFYKGVPTVFWSRGNGTVAIATCHDLASQGTAIDNAKLIAAAPELLEACKLALDAVRTAWANDINNEDAWQKVEKLKAAIAKAQVHP